MGYGRVRHEREHRVLLSKGWRPKRVGVSLGQVGRGGR